jgi:hypothetical protein
MSLYVKPEAYLLYGLHYVNDESHVKINLNRIFKNFKLPDYASDKLRKIYKECLSEGFEDNKDTLKFYKHLTILDPNIGFEFVEVFLNTETKLIIVPFGIEYYNKYKICVTSGYGIDETLIDVDELIKVSNKKENDIKECYAWFKKYNIDIEAEGFEFSWKLVSYINVVI